MEVQLGEQDHSDEVNEHREEIRVFNECDCADHSYCGCRDIKYIINSLFHNNNEEGEKVLNDKDGEEPLLCAIRGKNIQLVKQLLEEGVDVYGVNKHGLNSLHVAAKEGNLEMVEVLLNHTPNLLNTGKSNTTCDSAQSSLYELGFTALHFSIANNHTTVVELLLKWGANVNDVGREMQCTPLHMAVRLDCIVIVELLLNNGADINKADALGNTALHMAVQLQKKDIVRCLLDYKCDVNTINAKNQTALYYADTTNCTTFKWLLDAGIAIDHVDKYGNTVLMDVLSNRGSSSVVKLLISHRPKILVRVNDQSTLLHLAARYGDSEIIESIIDLQLNKSALNIHGTSALELAWVFDNEEGFICMLNNDCDLNVCAEHFLPLVKPIMFMRSPDGNLYFGQRDVFLASIYRPLFQHGKRLVAIGRSVSPAFTKLMDLEPKIDGVPGTPNYEQFCKNEVRQLKQLQFGDSRWTIYDALFDAGDHEMLLGCLSHISYEQIVKLAESLPVYGQMLVCRFRNVSKRKQLLDRFNEHWRNGHSIFSQLPWECLDSLVKYLSNHDLESLNNCFSL